MPYPNPYEDDIDPLTGRPRSRAQMSFAPPPVDASLGGMQPPRGLLGRMQQPSPLSGGNGGVNDPFKGTIGDPFGGGASTPKRAAPKPPAAPMSAPAPAAPASKWTQAPFDARDPSLKAYDTTTGPESPAWYDGPNAGAYNTTRMQAGTDTGMQPLAVDDPSAYAERGESAPRPNRGFLQSLGDWAGDAMTGIDSYVKDHPNLGQLGLNIMAAAHAPTKADQWSGLAGSFDNFGKANKADEDRKMTMEDREREIARQKKADATAETMSGLQIDELKANAEQRGLTKMERAKMVAAQQENIKALEKTNPELAALYRNMTPEQYSQFGGQKYLADQEAKLEGEREERQHRWQVTLQRDNQAFQEKLANIKDPKQKAVYLMGLQSLQAQAGAASTAKGALVDMNRLKALVNRLGEIGGMAQPLNQNLLNLYDNATKRGAGTEASSIRKEIETLSASMVKQYAESLKPMSNTDFEWVQSIVPNSSMTMSAALNRIESERSKLQWDVDKYYKMADWNEAHDGVIGTKDAQGRSFEESLGDRPAPNYDDSRTNPAGTTYAAPTQTSVPDQAIDDLRRNPATAAAFESAFKLPAGTAQKYLTTRAGPRGTVQKGKWTTVGRNQVIFVPDTK